jgi:hypothetical protein
VKTYEAVDLQFHFLTSALDGGDSGQLHGPAALLQGEKAWVGPKNGIDIMEKRTPLSLARIHAGGGAGALKNFAPKATQ